MRYWVYINNSVLERPFSREELPSIIGFTRETLICPEVLAPGQTQEWLPARMLLEPQIQQPPVYIPPQPYYAPPQPVQEAPLQVDSTPSSDPLLIEKLDSLYKEIQEIKDKLFAMDAAGITQHQPFFQPQAPSEAPATQPEPYQDSLQSVYAEVPAAPLEEEQPVVQEEEQPAEPLTISEDFSEEEIQDIPMEEFSDPQTERQQKPIEVLEVGDEAGGTVEDENFLQDAIKTTFTNRSKGKKVTQSSDVIIDLARKDSGEDTLTGAAPVEEKPAEEPAKEDDIPSVDAVEEEAPKAEELPKEEEASFNNAEETPAADDAPVFEEMATEKPEPAAEEYKDAEVLGSETPSPVEESAELSVLEDIPEEVPPPTEVSPIIDTDRSGITVSDEVQENIFDTPVVNMAAEQTPEEQPAEEAAVVEEEKVEEIPAEEPVITEEPAAEAEVLSIEEPAQEQEAAPAEEAIDLQEKSPEESQYDNLNIEKTESVEEKSVLEEFAADKQDTMEAPPEQQPAEDLSYIIESTTEETPASSPESGEGLSALDELTSRGDLAQDPAMAPQEQSIEDQFLKTFTSSIEEVFLDQPTAIISDYVPPEIANPEIYEAPVASNIPSIGDTQQKAEDPNAMNNLMDLKSVPMAEESEQSVRKVRRIKPAAIKTVPMVASNGEDIQNFGANGPGGAGAPNIDEAIAELGGSSYILKFVKIFSALLALLLIVLLFVALLATMKILPTSMSPAHALIIKVFGDSEEEARKAKAAALIDKATLDAVQQAEQAKKMAQEEILYRVKNYLLPEGKTLAEKIEANHASQLDAIEWTADQAVDPNYYSIAIKLPPNQEGYNLTYRFSYDQANSSLVPTTSESNNLMQPAARQPTAAEIEAAKTIMPSAITSQGSAAPPKVRLPTQGR